MLLDKVVRVIADNGIRNLPQDISQLAQVLCFEPGQFLEVESVEKRKGSVAFFKAITSAWTSPLFY